MRALLGGRSGNNKSKKQGRKGSKRGGRDSRRGQHQSQSAAVSSTLAAENGPHGLTPVRTPARDDEAHFTAQDVKEDLADETTQLPDRDLRPGEHLFLGMSGRYTYTRYLGHGAFGEVCEAVDNSDSGMKVAIKKQKGFFGHRKDAKLLLRELRILRLLREHPNIVRLHDIICPQDGETFDRLYVVFEFVDTDLRKLLDSNQNFTDLHVQYMLYQILLGVKYMHSASIIHRDLKPANILVNANCTLKICDFGLARGIEELQTPVDEDEAASAVEAAAASSSGETREDSSAPPRTAAKKAVMQKHALTRHVVTRWYRSPEVLLLEQRPGELLKAIDMWSVGCIVGDLFKMIAGNHDSTRHSKRRPLFPGGQSYLTNKDPFTWQNQKDQLNVIFKVMGTPSVPDINEIRDEHARQFLGSLEPIEGESLQRMFRNSPPAGIDLLRRLLTFLPVHRMNVEEALSHPYLSEIRCPENELETDLASFEFEEGRVAIPELREKIVEEIAAFHPEIQGGHSRRQQSHV